MPLGTLLSKPKAAPRCATGEVRSGVTTPEVDRDAGCSETTLSMDERLETPVVETPVGSDGAGVGASDDEVDSTSLGFAPVAADAAAVVGGRASDDVGSPCGDERLFEM